MQPVWWSDIPHAREFPISRGNIEERYGLRVVVGTHPIPQKYYDMHSRLGIWESAFWQEIIKPALADERIRIAYN